MGSKTKIYIVLEFATGGELFDTIVSDMHIAHYSLLVSAIPTSLLFQCPQSFPMYHQQIFIN
jgi:hypothetical protein